MCRRLTLVYVLSIAFACAAPADQTLAHLGAANQLLNQERFAEAAGEYEAALRDDPGQIAARRDLAVCRFELRQYDAAKQLLSELPGDATTRALVHYYLGRIDLIDGKLDAAIAEFAAIPRAHPYRDEGYFLGMAYFKSGAWERSVRILREGLEENPRDWRAHQLLARALQKLGREQDAAAEFAETRKLLSYYTEGSQALKRCGERLSAEACRPLLETDDVDQLAALGMVLGKAGAYDQAEAAWKRAASLDPDSSEIRYDLALTCFYLKDRVCARDNSKAAIGLRANFPEANVLYASVLYMMGADTEALPALRKAHALSPEDDSVRQLFCNELMLWAEQYARTGRVSEAHVLLTELGALQPLPPEQERRRLALEELLAREPGGVRRY